MKKRQFLQLIGTSIAGTAIVPEIVLSSAFSKKQQKNWVWIGADTETSDDAWKLRFDLMHKSGIDGVVVQVYNSHAALFDHPNPIVPVKADVLARLIPLAHAAGLEIHAWMWSMPCNIPEVSEKHPDWFAVNGNGDPAHTHPAYVNYYKFMCPSHPAVRDFVTGNVRALAAYEDLDGIHLDYIRLPDVILAEALQPKYNIVQDREYPQYDYCYSTHCREAFKGKFGTDPMSFEDPSQHHAWLQFRMDVITSLVNDHLVPAAQENNKFISAAVFPNWQSVRQQWHNWDLDAFFPMLYHNFYNENSGWIKAETRKCVKQVKYDQPIYSGLFVPSLDPEELGRAMKAAKKGGGSGVSLFNFGAMGEEHWEVFKSCL